MTGKLELEYEGELKGAEAVAQELVRSAVKQIFARRLGWSGSAADRGLV